MAKKSSANQDQKIARRYKIAGRVQGVGYRAFAQNTAREFGVTGWAKNLDDGDVEVYASGNSGQLDAFEGRLRQGPRWSGVRSVEVTEAEVSATPDFTIR